ncbi:integrin alpha-M-like [Hippoglossus hippoglossus]|uniref:integrin alpha-M-like n=1 Tax=Hippoglossus hippoglossus TaxID=8267 RepID=UPI00148DF59B|nr:integrin alpha-M-like [Hippoglossus hippoglossus]
MAWIFAAAVFISVLNTALCFNIDPVAWKSWDNSAAGFGYQVVQRQSDVLISAPLEQYSQLGRGKIYKCTTTCRSLPFEAPEFAVNMSLGLTMTNDPISRNTMACGPTIPKDCKSITMYSGACFQIDRFDQFGSAVPRSSPECRAEADIAFLLDGSGSVFSDDFKTMKNFVKTLVRPFVGKDTQFAVVQFSYDVTVELNFRDFFSSGQWESKIDGIRQKYSTTNTASAIAYVVQNVFTSAGGSRPNVKKILIVITDGASTDSQNLPYAISLAENAKIVRFAIGVGGAFDSTRAKQELDSIASSLSTNHVFRVGSFNALDAITKNLQDKIFSIEGSQSTGETLKMEMAQAGFSVAYVPGGIQMGTVGANQWKGGYMEYTLSGQKLSSYEPLFMLQDSYLGYSMTIAKTRQGQLTIVGAPRYQHRGLVMAVRGQINQKIDPFPWQFQTGEYFGAEVRAMDVNDDGYTDLILISAPMYKEADREGRVYVCGLARLRVECHFESPLVLRGDESDQARFGSSLAVLPDLNADDLREVAVGAPLENGGQGSIYIFHGEGGSRVSSTYSQKIAASEVRQQLRFFGMSISDSSFDRSGDSLPDLAVGSKGTVVLLRSKPVVMVEATMSFNPNQVPTKNPNCQNPLENTAEICFTMTKLSTVSTAGAKINYTLTLDATRKVPNNRAYIKDKQREKTGSIEVDLQRPKCFPVKFFIQACPQDALNVLRNELRFTFDGIPSITNLKPSLAQQAQTTTYHSLKFEINCGTDNKCVDNLKVDFNFNSSSELKVGIDELLDVTVSVENRDEDSYNSYVKLTYPAGLSYRKFTGLQGRIECNSLDSEDGLSRGTTTCTINNPIFKSDTEALFTVSYGIESNRRFDRKIFISANASSENQEHSTSSELYQMKWLDVKYSILVTIESSLSYNNFTSGKNDVLKPHKQSIVVTNNIRALNFTVVIKVPVKLGDKDIWVDPSSLQIPDCRREADEERTVTDFVAMIKENNVVDCSVARCGVFRCSRFMGRLESKKYKISANISSGWIEQIGLDSAKFLLTSTATLEYDTNQYIFFSTGSNNKPPIHKIEAEIEVYPQPDFTKEIVGGSLGGLALLALLTAGLYKAGFFKSKYKEMMNEAEEAAEPGANEAAATPEQ